MKDVFLTEYNEQKTMATFKDEYIEEGSLRTLFGLVKDGILTLAEAAKRARMTEDEFSTKLVKENDDEE